MTVLDYPAWLRIDHWLNVLFLTLVIRSGIEILSTHPKLYWHDDSRPGSEWARFTVKEMPVNKLYDTLDEEEDYSSLFSLPGHKKLGMGRHWHFFSVIGWILVGLSYYILLFATGQWHRYWPASWSIFGEAWNDIVTYMSFNLPPLLPGEPLDAIQKLTYAGVIFVLAPFQILTGAAQSPAIEAAFPWYVRMWGGRQWARSLHFLGLIAFVVFIVIHLSMIFFWSWGQLTASMIFGSVRNIGWATALSLVIIAAIVAVHVAATVWSLRRPVQVRRVLGAVVTRARKILLRPLNSRQNYPERMTSKEHRVNGKPPTSAEYKVMAVHNFVDWRVRVGGLVENPVTLDLDAARPGRAAIATRDAQLRAGVDQHRPVERNSAGPTRRSCASAPAGEVHLLFDHAGHRPRRAQRGGGGPVLRGDRSRTRLQATDVAGLRDEREAAAHQARRRCGCGWRPRSVSRWRSGSTRSSSSTTTPASATALGAGARTTSTTTRTWRSDMPDPSATRPELIDLQSVERERVSELVAVKGGHCAGCGGRDFAVGHALYLGFLFLDEDDDAFMVALTCRNDDCPAPRTGIVLAANEFLSDYREISDVEDIASRARARQASATWGGSGYR